MAAKKAKSAKKPGNGKPSAARKAPVKADAKAERKPEPRAEAKPDPKGKARAATTPPRNEVKPTKRAPSAKPVQDDSPSEPPPPLPTPSASFTF